jgi:hypothetical protein
LPQTGSDANSNAEGRAGALFTNFNYIDTRTIEAVQEEQVVKGIIPAEYGQALSGNVNLISKSGTNSLHGSMFENFQAENLNARNQFLTYKAPLTFNQFGGPLGGPIRRDRIFFFGVYEGYREASSSLVSGNVPTARFRTEMLGRQPQYKAALDATPLPTEHHAATADGRRYAGISSNLGFSTPASQIWTQYGPGYSIEQKVGLNRGKHSFKFGGDFFRRTGGRVKVNNPVIS